MLNVVLIPVLHLGVELLGLLDLHVDEFYDRLVDQIVEVTALSDLGMHSQDLLDVVHLEVVVLLQ